MASHFIVRHTIDSYTGWSIETIKCNCSLMELKRSSPMIFFSRKFGEVLIFWCLKRARWKKFRIVPKWFVFQPDPIQHKISPQIPEHIWSPKQIDLSLNTLDDIPRCPLKMIKYPSGVNRHQQTKKLPDTPEPCQDGKHTILAQPRMAGIFFTWPFWNIKILKPP